MLSKERSETRNVLPKPNQNPEKSRELSALVAKMVKDLKLTEEGETRFAILPPNHFRLLNHYPVRNAAFMQVEIFESRRTHGPNHARLYLLPQAEAIPTIIFGDYSAVAHSAWRDNRPAWPVVQAQQELKVDTLTLMYPDELVRFPGIADIIQNQAKLMYVVRPSSFVLADVFMANFEGEVVKAKLFINNFAREQVFCHITSPEEWTPAFPGLGLDGLTLTNSEVHVKAHPELSFKKVGDG